MRVTFYLVVIIAVLQRSWCLVLVEGPRDFDAVAGETIRLSCRVREILSDENIVWYHLESNSYLTIGSIVFTTDINKRNRYSIIIQDLIARNGDTVSEYTLQITDLQSIDNGEYQCGYIEQSNEPFRNLARAKLTVLLPRPECSIDYFGRTRAPRPGDQINLQCSSSGWNPSPDITWMRATETLSFDQQTTNSIIAWTLQATDENLVFTCEAFSEFLSVEKSCEVVPFPQPPDARLIQIGRIENGSNVTFICDAVGQQPLTYSWTISFNVLLQKRYYTEDNMRILHILDFQEEDNGTIVECMASYAALDMSSVASLFLILSSGTPVPSIEPTKEITDGPTKPSIPVPEAQLTTEAVIAIVAACIVVFLAVVLIFVIYTVKSDKTYSLDNVEGTVTHEDAKSTDNIAGPADAQSTEGVFNISSQLEHDTDGKQNVEETHTKDNIYNV
ncbi:cell adhesion molecule 2-like [Anneissia japonica]|uniref:cell adhesion molecule 2-like n=1 Tax=Anneissia japonica TaxID=1529436 RepID=UPI001425A587|nr:cell adhesion molecule 2-like [Anneissia japonica]